MQKMIVKKPWGTYEVLLDEPNYKSQENRRKIPTNGSLLQYHKHREEHWVVVDGDGIVQVNEKEYPAYVRTHWGNTAYTKTYVQRQARTVWFLLKLKLVIVMKKILSD